jgi:hypothetical protein
LRIWTFVVTDAWTYEDCPRCQEEGRLRVVWEKGERKSEHCTNPKCSFTDEVP